MRGCGRLDTRAALALPGVKAILTADDLPDLDGAERALTNEPLYGGEPIAGSRCRQTRKPPRTRSSASSSISSRCRS